MKTEQTISELRRRARRDRAEASKPVNRAHAPWLTDRAQQYEDLARGLETQPKLTLEQGEPT